MYVLPPFYFPPIDKKHYISFYDFFLFILENCHHSMFIMEELIFFNLLPSDQLSKSSQGDIWLSQFEYTQWGILLQIEEKLDKANAAIIQAREVFHFSTHYFCFGI